MSMPATTSSSEPESSTGSGMDHQSSLKTIGNALASIANANGFVAGNALTEEQETERLNSISSTSPEEKEKEDSRPDAAAQTKTGRRKSIISFITPQTERQTKEGDEGPSPPTTPDGSRRKSFSFFMGRRPSGSNAAQ